tara:strand:+ start:799 stop:1254 length:456 start_codon:yes stop_codon:yes gene_type:complete
MIKTIIKALYSAFISILLIIVFLAGWTTYAFIFKSSKSIEISKVLQNLYVSQKSVVFDVIDLSKILIKDTSKQITNDNENIFVEKEMLVDIEEDSQLDESIITEDNGQNSLGIVIQQALPQVSDNILPEIIEEPLVNEQNDFPMNNMEMHS